VAARAAQLGVRGVGEQGDGRRAGGGQQVGRAGVVADGQGRLGAQHGQLGEVGAAGQVAGAAHGLLDLARHGAFLRAADDDDVQPAGLQQRGQLGVVLDRPALFGPVGRAARHQQHVGRGVAAPATGRGSLCLRRIHDRSGGGAPPGSVGASGQMPAARSWSAWRSSVCMC
jgi:hypothetical protein